MRRFKEGDAVVREGTIGAAFFILLDGAASVSIDGEILRGLSSGNVFGELALLRGRPRSASVVAATDVVCLLLSPWDFTCFLDSHPDVARRLSELSMLYRH